jgi:transcriptional regulator GlxA family with amidase domain
MTPPYNVAILIFPEVEVLDFAGPFEAFAVTEEDEASKPFNVYLVAETAEPVRARHGFTVVPHYTISNCPPPDLFLVPGGFGTRQAMHNPALMGWITEQHQRTQLTLSVCTGAIMLGHAGLLNGLRATTHHTAFDRLRISAPNTEILENARVVDNGKIITSAGVSAGIDMSLHVIGRLCGQDVARRTARIMEYDWQAG